MTHASFAASFARMFHGMERSWSHVRQAQSAALRRVCAAGAAVSLALLVWALWAASAQVWALALCAAAAVWGVGLGGLLGLQATPPAAQSSPSSALHLEHHYAHQALELLKAGTWRIDYRESARHVYLSERALEISGRSPLPPDNRYPTEVWDAAVFAAGEHESSAAALMALQAAIEGRLSQYDVVYAYKRPDDGRVIWLRDVARLVRDEDGNLLDLFGIMIDVTETKRAEDAILEARRLAESATQMKSDFLANMSHEIRTPMNAIIGLSHLALKTHLAPNQRDYLQKIQQSGQHLLGIINDVLDFSKIEAGKLDVESEAFELSAVLENVVNLLGEKALSKNIELVVNVNSAVPNALEGDALRLGQILINYTSNAVKFTEKGVVNIAVYPLEETPEDVLIRFDVRDTGVGLTQAQMARLFQSFQQADASTTRQHGGTGLGLAISKSLAELMGGSVGVSSEYGKGSNFWFTVRLKKGVAAPSAQPDAPLEVRGRRVLVVDDNEHARLVLADMLNDMGLWVETADSGYAALSVLKANAAQGEPFELVFLDWQMPELDGMEVARRMAELGLAKLPPRIMVTAHGRDGLLKAAKAAGIDEVMTKPVKTSLLHEVVLRSLQPTGTVLAAPPLSEEALLQEHLMALGGTRVLLVEDNIVNQQVALELLAEVGCYAEIAENGQLAVEQVLHAQKAWDVVLMDLQMPVLDGLGATRKIREQVATADLPIIAMTASAMKQDQAVCMSAGMQDFVSKPIDPPTLWRVLRRWVKAADAGVQRPSFSAAFSAAAAPAAAPQDPPAPTPAAAPAVSLAALRSVPGLDVDVGLARVLGKEAAYLRILQSFVSNEARNGENIQTALQAQDWPTAQRLAHTTRSCAGHIGALPLQTLATQLEHALQAQDLAQTQAALATFLPALDALFAALQVHWPAPAAVPSATPAVPPAGLERVALRLMHLLQDDDAASCAWLEHHAALLQSGLPADFVALQAAVQRFDFQEAARVLGQALPAVANPAA